MTGDIITRRIMLLQRWLDRSSVANAPTPCGHAVIMGQFGCVVPIDFAAPPPTDFAIDCLPIFATFDQCQDTGITVDDFDGDGAPSQSDPADRIGHLLFKWGDGLLPPCVVLGLDDALEPPQAALDRAGLAGVDLSAFPVVGIPTWQLSDGARYRLRRRFPFVPKPGAVDPADDETVRQPPGVRDLYP